MSIKHLMWLAAAVPAIAAAALGSGLPSPAAAQEVSYPWCTQGEELHCYYATHEQCEEEVAYHGFCVNNPDYSAPNTSAPRRARR
ncbi:MAG: DUF3551 domain-containing protein [Xanthobacteraceae bacterium]